MGNLNTVEGFVVRNGGKSLQETIFSISKPTRSEIGFKMWDIIGRAYFIPHQLFPNLQWSDEPVKVKLSIEVIK